MMQIIIELNNYTLIILMVEVVLSTCGIHATCGNKKEIKYNHPHEVFFFLYFFQNPYEQGRVSFMDIVNLQTISHVSQLAVTIVPY